MRKVEHKNPIVNLLNLLPKQVSEEKRKSIDAELMEIGQYQHYRQCVKRPGWDMALTHVACAIILMKHLGLSINFFAGSAEQQEKEVARLVEQHYKEVLV